jgi:hypothetical protein
MTVPCTRVVVLAAATTALACRIPVPPSPSHAVRPAASVSASSSSLLAFRWEDGRLLATVDRRLLESDFVIRAQVAAVTRATGAETARTTLQAPVPVLGAHRASGVLRMRQAGDSLILLEYAGTVHGQPQYHHRATTPTLHATSASALVVDAAPLWAATEPQTTGEVAVLHDDTPGACCIGPRGSLGITPRSPGAGTLVQPLGGSLVTYQLAVSRLPEEPMRPRLYDPRIGFMYTGWDGKGQADAERYIYRWRLEKKDPAAPVSDVVKPIVFRIKEEFPERWVPYVRRAIEWWIPVLESVGFRNAIVVRLPGDAEDPERGENVIGWQTGNRGGGVTDHEVDPRTGEILSTKIVLREGMVSSVPQGYFAMAGGLDPRARVPFPDSLVGALLVYPLAHEVGHALGLHHNFRGSTVYPTDSLRRPSFLRRMGPVASIMGYSYVNYVAQPEDGVAVEDLLPRIGPYDRWALDWGYRPIPDAMTPEAELPILQQWRAVQDTVPYLRGPLQLRPVADGLDPANVDFLMGDDNLKSVDYGIRNLVSSAAVLASEATASASARRNATAESTGEEGVIGDRSLRSRMATRWKYYLFGVAELVGGRTPQAPYPADLDQIRQLPVDSARQLEAVRFLLAHVFYGQDELLSKHVLVPPLPGASPTLILFDTVNAGWTPKDWRQAQKDLLTRLLGNRRLERVAQHSPAVLAPLCQELATLDQRLSAAATDASAPARQEQARALGEILAAAFAPSSSACQPAHQSTSKTPSP